MKKTVILSVIDGLGLREEKQGNAFKLAKTPNFDKLFNEYPNSVIQASGDYVGLPDDQMGNSEVGHLNIGAGQIVYTGLSLINKDIKDNKFKQNAKFIAAFNAVKKNNETNTLHLMGLLSDGGVHSHEEHLFKLIEAAHENGLKNVSVHVFGDGRDVAPRSILTSIKKLEAITKKYNYAIGSIMGRFYAMDRDQIFTRNEQALEVMMGKTTNYFTNASEYIKAQYQKDISDEFFIPAINKDYLAKKLNLKDNDAVIFYNFRPDRARQLSHLLIQSNLYNYQSKNQVKLSNFTSMMKYEGLDTNIAYEEMKITNPLGNILAKNGLSQLRIAETQKYAHVTFFFDGGNDVLYENEERILIDSVKADSFADYPEMSAAGITDTLIANLGKYDVIILNYANPDMVGHTGNLKATIKALEFLDFQYGKILKAIEKTNHTLFITADHGNAEITEDENGNPATKHTTSPVMLIVTDKNLKLNSGTLANIAPTILDYLKIPKPKNMLDSLIMNNKRTSK
ncbi:2,3-bisphosphoglycerate-independent phosphoglycerate mutase [[Mycoplasma] mobile]|uniref:2,3-bisphosphoglycerate-independent phosphoglycerate mutase n=1 Tax=Mycoplasma mobile (strain ATCC 43663 / 163K / NCTC 11711) TaxID=267748 RepID=GPMI_MYCM1|nr:2,3-bisphosphoglycerate-independent phosphoglycerate mutase [[Mycoplasma] mobile]Q6KHV9.1 RecName: Full=2,3-bisphosphoglycerate-independent phosphoglycerate mutase; Short=BPG-independent PGAM; Short=Phosphoglyceromutase; Short=iPGM [Mycoplasma mobile 163K]AAT27817.1 phosphoglycerate mutase [Mycoplasma mobile 163K]